MRFQPIGKREDVTFEERQQDGLPHTSDHTAVSDLQVVMMVMMVVIMMVITIMVIMMVMTMMVMMVVMVMMVMMVMMVVIPAAGTSNLPLGRQPPYH